MEKSATGVDAYLRTLPDGDRATMAAVDEVIVGAMPGRSRTLWEGTFWGGTDQAILGYGDVLTPRARGEVVEWFLVGLARQKRHFSLYVNAAEDGAYLGQAYAGRLGKVKAGAASITFGALDDLDLAVVAELAAHAHRISPA